jgi:hypothetical protein
MRAWIAFLVGLTPWLASAADAYPSRPIRIIILVVPGGGADITSRAVGQKLTEAWGQQAIVDNRPGGNGIVGMEIAKNANPDGYTLVLGTIGPVAVNPSLYKLPYDPVNDYEPVARAVSALNVLVVHPSVPVKSVKEMIAYAKANPAKLNYGSSGVGFRRPSRRRAVLHTGRREDAARPVQGRGARDGRSRGWQHPTHLCDDIDGAREHEGEPDPSACRDLRQARRSSSASSRRSRRRVCPGSRSTTGTASRRRAARQSLSSASST